MNSIAIDTVPPLPPRGRQGHKGMFGRVLIVGGSDEMIGAPVLAGTAALRLGSGLVQIAIPKAVLPAAISITPELIGLGLTASDKLLLKAAGKADVLVIGPGLGQSPAARKRVLQLVKLDKPIVLDADALNLLAHKWPKAFNAQAVLTPHPGEMKRLTGLSSIPTDDNGRISLADSYAKSREIVLVLKGERTIVSDGKRHFANTTGDSSLSKGGSGDVLSGMLGCLLGQKMDRFDAACLAVHLHGRAGELAGKKFGRRSVLSRDVIDALPAAIAEMSADANN